MSARSWLIGAALALVSVSALAQAATESPTQTFRRLRSEGVAAVNRGDYAAAADLLSRADAAVPHHPGMILLRAKVEAAQEHMDAAVALMEQYAAAGFSIDVTTDELLQRISIENRFAPVLRQMAANAAPTGRLETVGSVEGAFIAEGIGWDAARRRWLISGVHGRTIVAVSNDRTLTRYLPAGADADAVQGLVVDAERGLVWAGTSGLPQARDLPADHRGRAGLLKIDLASGRLLARFDAPPTTGERAFGDLTVGPDGTIYVSDSLQGEIWRLRPGAAGLEPLVATGRLGSPQGLVVAPDGARLIVADYSAGLQVVDLADGAVRALPVPDNGSFIGVDGLIRDGADLIGFQNGSSPQRVVRLRLDPAFTRVERWSVLAANLPDLEEPTSGVVVGNDLVFVARSQWSDFGDDGKPRRDPVGPAVIARLKLR